jgi:hypothetical protein
VSVYSLGCPGGSRARAMLTRQPYCETEMVPSLHSNFAGAASASDAGFRGVAACWGTGASATGFTGAAQPAHEREINKTAPVRIRVASGKPRSWPKNCWLGPVPTDHAASFPIIQQHGLIRTRPAACSRQLDER